MSSVKLLDFYGGAADVDPKAYYDVEFDLSSMQVSSRVTEN